MKKRWFFKMFLLLTLSSVLLSACGLIRRSAADHAEPTERTVGEVPALEEQEEMEITNSADEDAEPAEAPTAKEMGEGGAVDGGAEMESLAEESFQSGPVEMEVWPTLAPPNDDPYIDNFFENYGVNPMIDTEDDHYSTFAIDVDTGSYTIARRYLRDGYLPDKDAVRVEEFVNYFDQNYRLPPDGQAFRITLDGGRAPFTETSKYQILRVGLQGYAIPAEERDDVSLTFVIDVSGSMDMENRLELVKHSLELLVDQLHRRDQVAIVVYGSDAHVILEPTSGAESEVIMDAIYRLQPEGSTNAAAGLELGYEMALRAFNSEGINRVILCSDGVANVGETSSEGIWDSIKHYASEGITLTTVGFGMGNYNDVLMEQLADIGDGFYAYVDTLQEAERLFVENLTSTLQVIAKDAKVQVDFNPQVVARYRLIGFENRDVADEDFRNDDVDAGEIGAGHSVTALYEFKLHPEAEGRVATVYMRWEDPETREVIELDRVISTRELEYSFIEADPYFQWDVLAAEFAEILRDSYWSDADNLDDLYEELVHVARWFEEDPERLEFVEMVETALWLMD